MMLAYHNTCSPAAARLTAPGTELLTKMKFLKDDFTIQVSVCREHLLLLPKTQLGVKVSSSIWGVLCSNHWATRWRCQGRRWTDCIVLEGVNGRKSPSSSWRLLRGQLETEWVVAGNTCDFHQQKEGSFYTAHVQPEDTCNRQKRTNSIRGCSWSVCWKGDIKRH